MVYDRHSDAISFVQSEGEGGGRKSKQFRQSEQCRGEIKEGNPYDLRRRKREEERGRDKKRQQETAREGKRVEREKERVRKRGEEEIKGWRPVVKPPLSSAAPSIALYLAVRGILYSSCPPI